MIEISLSNAAVEESSSNYLRFTATLSEASIDVVTMTYRTLLNGTAVDDDLYFGSTSNSHNGELVFAPGETSQDIFIRVDRDTIDEVDESITLELSNPSSNAQFQGGVHALRSFGIIRDNDGTASDLALFVSDPVIREDASEVAFDIELSRPAETDFTLTYRTADISATAGEDYTATSGSIAVRAGQSVARVVVPLSDDMTIETAEKFALIVEPPSLPLIDTTGAVGTATLLDTDSGAGPVVSIDSQPVGESSSNYIRFTVSLSEPAVDAVSMSYRTLLDQTATDPDVYFSSTSSSGGNGILTFAPGEITRSVFVRVDRDTVDEHDEAISLELFNLGEPAQFAGGGNTLSAKGIILDDEGVGSNLSLFVSDPTLIEGDDGEQIAVFDLILSRPAPGSITVDYETSDITATAGQDYTSTSGSITFAPGQDRAAVMVPVLGDTVVEAPESFALNVTTPSTVSINQQGLSGEARILDDDNDVYPVISIRQSTTADESSSFYLRYVVTLSEASEEPVTVDFQTSLGTAVDGDLYTPSTSANNNGTLTFEAGATSASIFIRLDRDSDDERDESVFLTLSNPTRAVLAGGEDTLSAVGFIQDNDGVGLNIALAGTPTTISEPSEGSRIVEVPVSLSRAPNEELTFDVVVNGGSATAGSDFVLLEDSITFAPGQVHTGVKVRINGDTEDEGLENFLLNFAARPGSSFAGTVLDQTITIRNTEPPHVNTPPEGEVALSGTPQVGESLSADTSGVTDVDGLGGFSYQWLRDGEEISGATSSIYTLTEADVDARISVQVMYRDGAGTDETLVSPASGAVAEEPMEMPLELIGTTAADVLRGAGLDDTLIGLDGDDRLLGNGGNDLMRAGDGADTINGGDGDDEIFGGETGDDLRDVVYAGEGNDSIDAGAGNDLVFGQNGNDTIAGGFGVDELQGQDGDDVITGSAFSDLVFGGAGNDFVNGGFGSDRINGGSGADKFFHVGVEGHGSDWVQDYLSPEGDVLLWGGGPATADDFQVNFAHTANDAGERSGDDAVQEAFVIYKPTEQIIWALVDGGGQDEINIQIGSDVFDLMS